MLPVWISSWILGLSTIIPIKGQQPMNSQYGYRYENDDRGFTRRKNNILDYYLPQPLRSYVIFEGDARNLPDNGNRPKVLSGTREWHIQFNRENDPRKKQPQKDISYQTVSSNLLQVLDEPYQRKYFGPFDGKAYVDSSRRYPDFVRPLDVPKFEVIYPYDDRENSVYKSDQLPEKFPAPFSPNVNFKIREPDPVDMPKRDYGFYRPQTINYNPSSSSFRRTAGAKELCNYIRVNNKGFPPGNEMCGRSVSDIILSEEYPTTGELILEHRKRYRGAFAENSDESRFRKFSAYRRDTQRKKRNAEYFTDRETPYKSSCCQENSESSYDYRGNNGHKMDSPISYDDIRFLWYQGDRDSGSYANYGYRNRQGQSFDNDGDSMRGDGSNNRGLTSYMTNRGRDHEKPNDSQESDEDDDSDYRFRNSGGNNKDNNKHKKYNNSNRNNKTHGNNATSTNGDKNKSNSRGSSADRRWSDRRHQYNDDEENYDNNYNNNNDQNSGRSDRPNNNYGYMRTYDSDRTYGSRRPYSSGGTYDESRSYDSLGNYGMEAAYNSAPNYDSRRMSGRGYNSGGGFYQGRSESNDRFNNAGYNNRWGYTGSDGFGRGFSYGYQK